jgi:hypothetical protein
MDTNPMGTTTTQIGQLADAIVTLGVGPDTSMADATASLCDATFYVPELLALANRSRASSPSAA